jgi:hypothetical protein
MRVSVNGLNVSFPEIAIAVTISGEATNAYVFGFPSARFAKLRLNEWITVLTGFLSDPFRSH